MAFSYNQRKRWRKWNNQRDDGDVVGVVLDMGRLCVLDIGDDYDDDTEDNGMATVSYMKK